MQMPDASAGNPHAGGITHTSSPATSPTTEQDDHGMLQGVPAKKF